MKNLSLKYNSVLQKDSEYVQAFNTLRGLQLPTHADPYKNWDSLAALQIAVNHTTPRAQILDAGGEYYSAFLPQLAALGFKNLTALNIAFKEPQTERDKIKYIKGDITNSKFASRQFHFVACLSVIEHGVDIHSFLSEMYRILKPNGILFTSFDYWPTSIDTKGQYAYGVPIKIFNKAEVHEIVALAKNIGFRTKQRLTLNAKEKVVCWKQFGLQYTFCYITLQKAG